MVPTDVTHTSTAFGVLGFFLVAVSLISYILKQRLFIVCRSLGGMNGSADDNAQSGAIVALAVGVIVGPVVLNWVNPHDWTEGNEEYYDELVLQVTRLVIGIRASCLCFCCSCSGGAQRSLSPESPFQRHTCANHGSRSQFFSCPS